VGAARASDSEASLERVVISNIVVDELSSFVHRGPYCAITHGARRPGQLAVKVDNSRAIHGTETISTMTVGPRGLQRSTQSDATSAPSSLRRLWDVAARAGTSEWLRHRPLSSLIEQLRHSACGLDGIDAAGRLQVGSWP